MSDVKGWRLVPVEPTEEMFEGFRSVNCKCGKNGMEEFTSFYGDYGNWIACYRGMLAAAPESPASHSPLIEELRDALRPFAELADAAPKSPDDHTIIYAAEKVGRITVGDLRRARAALAPTQGGESK